MLNPNEMKNTKGEKYGKEIAEKWILSKTIIWGKFHRKRWDKEINNTKDKLISTNNRSINIQIILIS